MELKHTHPTEKKELLENLAHHKEREPKHMNPKPYFEKPEKIEVFEGEIVEWIYNGDYIYDGFYLQTEKNILCVKFFPYLGKEIREFGLKNPSIKVKGVMHFHPDGKYEFRLFEILDAISCQKLDVIDRPSHDYVKYEGKITELLYNEKEDCDGFMIENKYLVKIPPHKMVFLQELIKSDMNVVITGKQKPEIEGEVKARDYIIVHGTTISVNGTEYLIKK